MNSLRQKPWTGLVTSRTTAAATVPIANTRLILDELFDTNGLKV